MLLAGTKEKYFYWVPASAGMTPGWDYMPTSKRVMFCGNAAFDLITSKSRRSGDFRIYATPGGSVFNTAIFSSRLGHEVSVIAKCGADFLGDSLVDTMQKEGISTKHVVKAPGIKTGLALATVDAKGVSSYIFYKTEGPAVRFGEKEIPGSAFKGVAVFHTGSAYSYEDHSWRDALKFVRMAKNAGAYVSYDPNWRAKRLKDEKSARKRAFLLMDNADILKLSDSDAEGLTGGRTLDACLKKLGRGAYVTLGERGALYWDGKRKIYRQAFKVKLADTIGAGDAFSAGLIFRYSSLGKDRFLDEIMDNLTFAQAVSASACTFKGATSGFKGLSQVKTFLVQT